MVYKYKANVINVVDGDTCDLLIDVGFNIHIKERVRLLGINTPETRTRNLAEKKLGIIVKDYVKSKIGFSSVMVSTKKKGKFGRYLGIIYYKAGSSWRNLNKELVRKGYAKKYYC